MNNLNLSKRFLAIAALILLCLGIAATYYLVTQEQDVRQRAEAPSCPVTQAICSWSTLPNATGYHVKITDSNNQIIKNEPVSAPTTSLAFPSQPDIRYTCEVYAINACGPGPVASTQTTCPGLSPTPTNTPPTPTPTLTPIPTPTAIVITGTPVPPTPTRTPTPVPPTPTRTPTPTLIPTRTPTPTPVPPTPTRTPTPVPPTATPVPPVIVVATSVPPTQAPPQVIVVQATPRPTIAPTGTAETTMLLGAFGTILTIIGFAIFFAL